MKPVIVLEDVGETISSGIASKLIPNLGSFLTQLLALIVMILVIVFLGYKPIKKMVKKRQDFVETTIKDAKEQKALAEQSLKQSEEKIISSSREAEAIIEQAKKDANKEREAILESTRDDISKMKKDAEISIKQSEEEAKETIRKEIISVALDASSELLKRNVTSKDNEKLVEDFIEDKNK